MSRSQNSKTVPVICKIYAHNRSGGLLWLAVVAISEQADKVQVGEGSGLHANNLLTIGPLTCLHK